MTANLVFQPTMSPRGRRMVAAYQRQLTGERITLQRRGSPDCSARGRIVGFSEAEIVGGIQEGQRKLIVFAPDIPWPEPLREGDLAVIGDLELYINTVDDQKRRVDGYLVAYEATASGR
ncbi:hypothetical protein NS226_07170 [Aureimonas ureilytica]|uniref:Uncharacterized protein n=1 Tax=Aureimonas ureilytica TaxID=401562 RepID=A0A175RCK9_9HYPH|nr:hypothetical protein [Aureimonas ureilytica]KTQ96576.1 hypothetical protein NS226_07170 [Aureimonas ureilytica]